MSGLELTARLVAGVVLTAANAFFVMTEFALTRAPQLGKEQFQSSKGLRTAWKMTEELEIYLTGCQLGISVTSVLLGVVVEPGVTELVRPALGWLPISEAAIRTTSIVVSVATIQFIHKIWGEQAPTYLGVERPKQVAQFAAPILYWFTKITYPVIRAGDGLAKLTLRLFGVEVTRSWAEDDADEGGTDDGPREGGSPRHLVARALVGAPMSRDRKQEVERAVEIDQIPIRRICTPRAEVRALYRGQTVDDAIELLRDRVSVRLPLLDRSLDDCVGVLHAPVLLANIDELRLGDVTLEQLAHEPVYLDAELSVAAAIDRLQEERRELAIVCSGGRAIGVITSTDCFEAIVGQLEDPYD